MKIERADPDDHLRLTEIAHASKRHWGYPERWIEIWREDLTLTAELIRDHPVYAAWVDGEIVGCYALATGEAGDPHQWSLEHMWVDPKAIGRGVGGALFDHLVEIARAGGATSILILSDPNAVGFYEHVGAEHVGDHVGELEGRPRILPIYVKRLEP